MQQPIQLSDQEVADPRERHIAVRAGHMAGQRAINSRGAWVGDGVERRGLTAWIEPITGHGSQITGQRSHAMISQITGQRSHAMRSQIDGADQARVKRRAGRMHDSSIPDMRAHTSTNQHQPAPETHEHSVWQGTRRVAGGTDCGWYGWRVVRMAGGGWYGWRVVREGGTGGGWYGWQVVRIAVRDS